VLDYIDFYARAYGFGGKEREMRVREVMDFTDLMGIQDRLSNKLSKGMTQRLCLARTMLHDPEVLILDEPAAGLDPKARVELKNLIRILSEEGKTIFISSHILSELGEMCDSMLFINEGKIVHHGSAESLQTFGKEAGTVYYVETFGSPLEVEQWTITTPYVSYLEQTVKGGRIRLEPSDNPELAAEVLRSMVTSGLKVREFRQEQQDLESAFINILNETNAQ